MSQNSQCRAWSWSRGLDGIRAAGFVGVTLLCGCCSTVNPEREAALERTSETTSALLALESGLIRRDQGAREEAGSMAQVLVALVSIAPEAATHRILELMFEDPEPRLADIYALAAIGKSLYRGIESPKGRAPLSWDPAQLARLAHRGVKCAESQKFSEDQIAAYGEDIIEILRLAKADLHLEAANPPPYPSWDDSFSTTKLSNYLKWEESMFGQAAK